MCNKIETDISSVPLPQDLIEEAVKQSDFVTPAPSDLMESSERLLCTEEDRIQCALQYGPRSIDSKILVSISENINAMAAEIHDSEKQKAKVRKNYVIYFSVLLGVLLAFAMGLILADTFWGYHVRTEFMLSVIVAIIADIFAIVHTLVRYMTNVEHYEVYNKLIDSLLAHLTREDTQNKSPQ